MGMGSALGAESLLPGSAYPRPEVSPAAFEEVLASASGISWVHVNGRSPMAHLPETVGAGCAFLDYDNDGWMDIYLVNSGPCDFYVPPQSLHNALYRNNRDGTFTDVTHKAGVAGDAYGMGIAVGDYNRDGFPDLYVTQYPHSILYRNNGDGTFTDVTAKAGVAAPGWATSAVWFDYDNDGKLDLFVCSFVDYSVDHRVGCGNNALGKYYYCIPKVFVPTRSFLYHNNGNGTFTEVGTNSIIGKTLGKALGVVATDINNDGEVIGYASLSSGYEHAFSAIGAVMTDLGTLGGSSFAYGINDSGAIVGYSWPTNGDNPDAFLYLNGMMVDLNSLIPSGFGVASA